MRQPMIITERDYQQLMRLMELASLSSKMPKVTNRLFKNLLAAQLLPQTEIDSKVVTMNSRVRLKDVKSKREAEITVSYPQDAEPGEGRISVLSEIGLALLGRRENDIVSWNTPGGVGVFEVEKVVYQPEAAGDYAL
jgi:regulator of nucleoside diphosphate kinase